MKSIYRVAVALGAALCVVLGLQAAALACNQPPPPKEISVCWQVVNPDLSQPNSAEFPQTFVAEGTAQDSLETLCPTPPCDTQIKVQFDKYWIKGDGDQRLYDYLKEHGLNKDSHGPQDTPLNPHDWSVAVLDGGKCESLAASFKIKAYTGCAPSKRYVAVTSKHNVASITKRHNKARTVWHLKATAVDGALFSNGKSHMTKTRRLHVPTRCSHPHGS